MPITNYGAMNKPHGGLWASPVGAEHSWYEWVKDNQFYPKRLELNFEFELSPDARVLELTPENVWHLPMQKDAPEWIIERSELRPFGMIVGVDFETLAQKYDVLECSLTEHPSLYWSLYGWDCDCILVMNPDMIVEVLGCTK